MNKAVLYFNYLSAYEERSYARYPDILTSLLKKPCKRDAEIERLDQLCVSQTGASVTQELSQRRLLSDPMMSRFVQFYLHLMMFELVRRHFDIVAVAGYSAGYWLASVACRLYDPLYFRDAVTPIMMDYRESNWASWQEDRISSCFLFHPMHETLNGRIKQWLSEPPFLDKVWVKDDRPPCAVQVAGLRHEVEELVARVRLEYSGIDDYSTRPRRSDAAHIGLYDHSRLLKSLRRTALRAPNLPIVASDGALLAANSWDSDEAASVLFRAIVRPLSMTLLSRALRSLNVPVLAIGSERVTRFSFHGIREGDRPRYLTVWDGYTPEHETPPALTLIHNSVW